MFLAVVASSRESHEDTRESSSPVGARVKSARHLTGVKRSFTVQRIGWVSRLCVGLLTPHGGLTAGRLCS